MDRIPDVDQSELNDLIAREQAKAQSAMWGDNDLTARIDGQGFDTNNPIWSFADKRSRAVIAYHYVSAEGCWKPTRLKQFDHVMLIGFAPCVVAMPARGREYFLGYAPEYYGAQLVPLKWDTVTDRAPNDLLEPSLPINVAPALEQQPPCDDDDEDIVELEILEKVRRK
jgi:hypothetical protein